MTLTATLLAVVDRICCKGLLCWPMMALGVSTFSLIAVALLPFWVWFGITMSPWQVVHVDYEHRAVPICIIGTQFRDLGGLGYRRRKARVCEFGPWLHYSVELEGDVAPGTDWRPVDQSRNPFGWKGG